MKNTYLYPRLFALLTLGFILCTIIGTVTHEMGHQAVAQHYGYKTHLSYGALSYETPHHNEFRDRYERDKEYIESDEDSPQKADFIAYRAQLGRQMEHNAFYITLGGPVQTMLTGTLGFIILLLRRKRIFARGYLLVGEWLAVLLAYFWSRQVFNFVFSAADTCGSSACSAFASDEPRLSLAMGLPAWAFGLATCVVGGAVLLWVTFRAVPAGKRFTFILSGLAGCTLGWYIWMHWLGPQLLPA